MSIELRLTRNGRATACAALLAIFATSFAETVQAQTSQTESDSAVSSGSAGGTSSATPPVSSAGSSAAANSGATSSSTTAGSSAPARSGANSSAAASSPESTPASPATPASSPSAGGTSATPKGDTGSAASIDNFIPGSEVLPAPQSSSDDFIKKQKPTMDLGMLLHKNREYRQALSVFEKLPPTDKSHYYMGLCYKALGNQQSAKQHLAWVAYYSKDAQLKNYALAAVRAMKPVKPPKQTGGVCFSSKYTRAETINRNEERQARIQAEAIGRHNRGELVIP